MPNFDSELNALQRLLRALGSFLQHPFGFAVCVVALAFAYALADKWLDWLYATSGGAG